tara:strand:+ start:601 stop:927 length:327 start_codon:yes stop_codon:yes gene_type:complete
MEKFIYLNDNSNVILLYPASSFRGCYPKSDTTLELYFTPINEHGYAPNKDNDVIILTIGTNKHKEVMLAIGEEINTGEVPYTTIIDVATGVKVSTHVTSFTYTASSNP